MVPGHRGALLVAKLVGLSVDHITEKIGAIRVARATGGVPVLVCNLDLDLWIWGYLYGYVCMSHYITPAGRPAFPVGKFCNSLTDFIWYCGGISRRVLDPLYM